MSAYVIVEIDVVDPVGYEEYKKLAGATVEKYGGKYITRGGKTEVLEGDWQPKRIVVLQFDSMQRAKDWLHCEEYREPRKMRHRTARTNMVLVEGVWPYPRRCATRTQRGSGDLRPRSLNNYVLRRLSQPAGDFASNDC